MSERVAKRWSWRSRPAQLAEVVDLAVEDHPTEPSSLWMGWSPPARSMIASLRIPRASRAGRVAPAFGAPVDHGLEHRVQSPGGGRGIGAPDAADAADAAHPHAALASHGVSDKLAGLSAAGDRPDDVAGRRGLAQLTPATDRELSSRSHRAERPSAM